MPRLQEHILNGAKGPKTDAVLFNSAAAVYLAKDGITMQEALEEVREVIASGKAAKQLEAFATLFQYAVMQKRKGQRRIDMILQEIAENTRKRLEKIKEEVPLKEVQAKAQGMNANTGFPFKKALKAPGMSFICEVKKASPSKGVIAETFPYLEIAKEYQEAGASSISVLTEPDYFQGSPRYLQEISQMVSIPTLRKDFVVDVYQIYEAKLLGASAVLLISELLTEAQLKEYLEVSWEAWVVSPDRSPQRSPGGKSVKSRGRYFGSEQPESGKFPGRYGNQRPLKKTGAARDCVCIGERHPYQRRYHATGRSWCGRCTHRRNLYEKPG